MSMLLNLVTSGWFSDPNCIFCNIGWMFCSKGKRGLLHTVHKLAIEFYFMGFHECCNLFGSTHKLMKQKFKWAVNLDINFMHFLTADQQKLGQVTGEKSVDIFLLYHTLFNVNESSNYFCSVTLQAVQAPESSEKAGFVGSPPNLSVQKCLLQTSWVLPPLMNLPIGSCHLCINSDHFFS